MNGKRITKQEIENVKQLLAKRVKYNDIAACVGISRKSVSRIAAGELDEVLTRELSSDKLSEPTEIIQVIDRFIELQQDILAEFVKLKEELQ